MKQVLRIAEQQSHDREHLREQQRDIPLRPSSFLRIYLQSETGQKSAHPITTKSNDTVQATPTLDIGQISVTKTYPRQIVLSAHVDLSNLKTGTNLTDSFESSVFAKLQVPLLFYKDETMLAPLTGMSPSPNINISIYCYYALR